MSLMNSLIFRPGSSSVSYVYSKVYSGLVFLANDPHIDVSSMASKLVEYLKLKAKDKVLCPLVLNPSARQKKKHLFFNI